MDHLLWKPTTPGSRRGVLLAKRRPGLLPEAGRCVSWEDIPGLCLSTTSPSPWAPLSTATCSGGPLGWLRSSAGTHVMGQDGDTRLHSLVVWASAAQQVWWRQVCHFVYAHKKALDKACSLCNIVHWINHSDKFRLYFFPYI